MRYIIAALLGAIVVFLWGFVAHMLLPIGEMGMRKPANEDVVLQAVASGLPQQGIYLLPHIDPEKMGDKATVDAWEAKAGQNRFAFVAVGPTIAHPTDMSGNLTKQFIGSYLGALIVALVLAATNWSFGARVLGSFGFGVFGWLTNIVPLWNWYRFPDDFNVGNLIEQGVGWLLAGVVIAWWLGRRK